MNIVIIDSDASEPARRFLIAANLQGPEGEVFQHNRFTWDGKAPISGSYVQCVLMHWSDRTSLRCDKGLRELLDKSTIRIAYSSDYFGSEEVDSGWIRMDKPLKDCGAYTDEQWDELRQWIHAGGDTDQLPFMLKPVCVVEHLQAIFLLCEAYLLSQGIDLIPHDHGSQNMSVAIATDALVKLSPWFTDVANWKAILGENIYARAQSEAKNLGKRPKLSEFLRSLDAHKLETCAIGAAYAELSEELRSS